MHRKWTDLNEPGGHTVDRVAADPSRSRQSVLAHRPAKLLALVVGLSILASIVTLDTGKSRAAGARAAAVKPTIVLIHGAWASSASWTGVIERLQAKGYTVDAPPNPLRSLKGDAASIADFLKTITGPIVLVGHSYGGAVITNAARGDSQVKALVYVDAFAPNTGETTLGLDSARPGSALAAAPAKVFNLVPYPGAPKGDAEVYVKPAVFESAFANDLSPRQAAIQAAIQSPAVLSALTDPSGAPAWKTIPSWYVLGTIDQVIPPAEQLFMAQRMHAHIVKVKAGHLSMVSQPEAVTKVIISAAHTVH
jgi:pimeloyl-ACP methyl ester carboxylesterase